MGPHATLSPGILIARVSFFGLCNVEYALQKPGVLPRQERNPYKEEVLLVEHAKGNGKGGLGAQAETIKGSCTPDAQSSVFAAQTQIEYALRRDRSNSLLFHFGSCSFVPKHVVRKRPERLRELHFANLDEGASGAVAERRCQDFALARWDHFVDCRQGQGTE